MRMGTSILAAVIAVVGGGCAAVDELSVRYGDTMKAPAIVWDGQQFNAWQSRGRARPGGVGDPREAALEERSGRLLASVKEPIGRQYWVLPNERLKFFHETSRETSFSLTTEESFLVAAAVPEKSRSKPSTGFQTLDSILYQVEFASGRKAYLSAWDLSPDGLSRHSPYLLREDPQITRKRKEEERILEEKWREEKEKLEAQQRAAEERRRVAERIAEIGRREQERQAERQRVEQERRAELQRMEKNRLAEEKRKEQERIAEKRRQETEEAILQATGLSKGRDVWLGYALGGLSALTAVRLVAIDVVYPHIKMTISTGGVQRHLSFSSYAEIKDAFRVKNPALEWDKRVLTAIKQEKVFIGMTDEQVRASWGLPRHVKRTAGKSGVLEQWEYGSKTFLHFENGKLTFWKEPGR